jgi:hypothetical protein
MNLLDKMSRYVEFPRLLPFMRLSSLVVIFFAQTSCVTVVVVSFSVDDMVDEVQELIYDHHCMGSTRSSARMQDISRGGNGIKRSRVWRDTSFKNKGDMTTIVCDSW